VENDPHAGADLDLSRIDRRKIRGLVTHHVCAVAERAPRASLDGGRTPDRMAAGPVSWPRQGREGIS
jgi:hypothetical protein